MRTKKPSPVAPVLPIDGSLEAMIVSLPVELLIADEAALSMAAPPGENMPVPVSIKPPVGVRAVSLLPDCELRVY